MAKISELETRENLVRIAKKYGCDEIEFLKRFKIYEKEQEKNIALKSAIELTGDKKKAIELIKIMRELV